MGEPLLCPETSKQTYRIGDNEVEILANKEIVIHGRDAHGFQWTVQSSYPGDIPCRFFVYDIDRNRYADLIFVIPNAGSGPAGVTLLVIAFDSRGRPIPWQATGPFEVKSNGISQFIAGDTGQQAELLYQSVTEHGPRRDWITQTTLYRIDNGEFRHVRATPGRVFPLFSPYRVAMPDAPDLVNAASFPRSADRVTGQRPGKDQPCWLSDVRLDAGGILLRRGPARKECEGYVQMSRSGSVPLPLMVVLDSRDGGRFIDVDHSIVQSVQRIIAEHLEVSFAGKSCETGCRPLVMWARQAAGVGPDARSLRPGK